MTTQKTAPISRGENGVSSAMQQAANPKEQHPLVLLKTRMDLAVPEAARFLSGDTDLAERFSKVVYTEVRNDPKLAKCTADSICGSLISAARYGLEIGAPLNQAYLVPFNKKLAKRGNEPERWVSICTLMPSYRGKMLLAQNSGMIKSARVRCVYEGDRFVNLDGLKPVLEHEPMYKTRRDDDILYAYAVIETINGGIYWDVMHRSDIDRRRAFSKGKDGNFWTKWYSEMAKKTVLHAALKLLPAAATRHAALDVIAATYRGGRYEEISEGELVDPPHLESVPDPAPEPSEGAQDADYEETPPLPEAE